ncbi:hypothetical protein BDW66DRAFT_145070 [Aspergillus desertorum]
MTRSGAGRGNASQRSPFSLFSWCWFPATLWVIGNLLITCCRTSSRRGSSFVTAEWCN